MGFPRPFAPVVRAPKFVMREVLRSLHRFGSAFFGYYCDLFFHRSPRQFFSCLSNLLHPSRSALHGSKDTNQQRELSWLGGLLQKFKDLGLWSKIRQAIGPSACGIICLFVRYVGTPRPVNHTIGRQANSHFRRVEVLFLWFRPTRLFAAPTIDHRPPYLRLERRPLGDLTNHIPSTKHPFIVRA